MQSFCPVIWEEEPVPNDVKGCGICGLDKHGTRMVWSEGNPEAKVMIVVDNPGERERRGGEPYICGTRQTLQEVANDAGFQREELYLTFLLKRRPTRAYDKPRTRALCLMHLLRQLREKSPLLVICLGNVVVQSFFDDPSLEVKGLRGKLYEARGYPVIVSYHPLAVRRRPNLKRFFQDDWSYIHRVYTEYIKNI